MADQQQLTLLKQRVRSWNRWQQQHANAQPDLSFADLAATQLSDAQLQRANLHGARLSHALLCDANLSHTDLSQADLRFANLTRANLSHADLTNADLNQAKLQGANLNGTRFQGTILANTNLNQAHLQRTIFGNVDLSTARGLESVYHLGPSTLGIDTLARSRPLPESFLRGVGMHENLLTALQEQGDAPFDYASVFVSYANEDFAFAHRLREDLHQAGVWCWFAPDALRGGDFFKARIDQAIHQCDRLLVVFSQHARDSGWVHYEVDLARQKEKKHKLPVILPLSLDTTLFHDPPEWAAFLHKKRHIRDFRLWKDNHSYQSALREVLDDLRIIT